MLSAAERRKEEPLDPSSRSPREALYNLRNVHPFPKKEEKKNEE
jgi:hypothetical protein